MPRTNIIEIFWAFLWLPFYLRSLTFFQDLSIIFLNSSIESHIVWKWWNVICGIKYRFYKIINTNLNYHRLFQSHLFIFSDFYCRFFISLSNKTKINVNTYPARNCTKQLFFYLIIRVPFRHISRNNNVLKNILCYTQLFTWLCDINL